MELLLLEDGSVLAAGQSDCNRSGHLIAVEQTPTRLLQLLEEWLAPFEEGEITILVRSTDVPIITWTTRSAGMALYWTAVVLGKTWPPAATIKLSVPPRIRQQLGTRRGFGPALRMSSRAREHEPNGRGDAGRHDERPLGEPPDLFPSMTPSREPD